MGYVTCPVCEQRIAPLDPSKIADPEDPMQVLKETVRITEAHFEERADCGLVWRVKMKRHEDGVSEKSQ